MLSRSGRSCQSRLILRLFLSWEKKNFLLGQQLQPGQPDLKTSVRSYGVFENFRKQVKGEIDSNAELRKSYAELKEKAGDFAQRTRATTESLYKKVDAVREEAEAKARQVSAAVKDTVAEATQQVKESVGTLRGEGAGEGAAQAREGVAGAQADGTTGGARAGETGTAEAAGGQAGPEAAGQEAPGWPAEGMLKRARDSWATAASGLGAGLRAVRQTRAVDAVKQGYTLLREELSTTSSQRRARQKQAQSQTASTTARSDSTALVVAPGRSKAGWEKRWEDLRNKARGHPVFQRLRRVGEPVLSKGQEMAEDLRDRWETSDSAVVHRIQDLNESLFGETAPAAAMREIRRRDPTFTLPEFIQEVQEDVRPVLLAYLEGDLEVLRRKCRREVVERCQAERRALAVQGLSVESKILHISDVEVRETKLLQSDPIIIVGFHTQQTSCTKDRHGSIVEGGKDDILTVYYAWAMQQASAEEVEEGRYESRWKLREMQQLGMQALI